ncbi:MAG: hypothetical protein IT457_14750 [Planctomycetes bacterium]|nr:hypothetical protein [Planctomycetota bacterium]
MKLCFLDAVEVGGGAVRGAALVTDTRTRPLEFRVTDPVLVDELQRVLYGAVLDQHVIGELCGLPLLEALRETPDCVLVRKQDLLSLQGSRQEPVVWIGRDEESTQADGRPRVVLGYHDGGDAASLQRVRDVLRQVAEHYDLCEPYERIAAALAQLQRDAAPAR